MNVFTKITGKKRQTKLINKKTDDVPIKFHLVTKWNTQLSVNHTEINNLRYRK